MEEPISIPSRHGRAGRAVVTACPVLHFRGRSVGASRMVDDPVGAFVPGPRTERAGAPAGPLAGLTFAVKDLYDTAGDVTGYGNPDWARTHAPATADAAVVTALLEAGAAAGGQDQDGRTRLWPDRRECLVRHADQSGRAGPLPRRLLLRVGRGGRGRARRHRHGVGHRRVGAHPGILLRHLRHPPVLGRGQPDRRLPARAGL